MSVSLFLHIKFNPTWFCTPGRSVIVIMYSRGGAEGIASPPFILCEKLGNYMVLENGEWPWSFSRNGLQSRWLDHQVHSFHVRLIHRSHFWGSWDKASGATPLVPYIPVSIRVSSIQVLCLSKLCSHHSTKLHPSILQPCSWDPSRLRATGTALPLHPSSLGSHLIPSMLLDWGWKTSPVALVWPHALLFSFLGMHNSMLHRV